MENQFEQLSNETLAKVKAFGIKSKSVIKSFKQSSRKLSAYLKDNRLEFSLDTGRAWLQSVCPSEPVSRSQRIIYLARRRAVMLLAESQAGTLDTWRIYPSRLAARPATAEYLRLLHSHEQRLKSDGMAKETVSFALRVDSDFLSYLEASGKLDIAQIAPRDVTGYFARDAFSGRKPDGVKAYAYKLKSFLTFLEETGTITGKTLSLAVPKVFAKHESIVTVLSEKAVSALQNGDNKFCADTEARDHAMILLALHLGIRRSDIIKMKLSDIDWQNDKISFVQQKTGVPVILPLLPDVGNALMDYILNFRPRISADEIFLRHYAPYQAISPCSSVVEKRLSAFESEDCPQRGFHILRRTLATGMLRTNIPRSVISAAIGQVDPNSVDVYLSADESNMRKCALSLEGIECTRGDLR